MSGLTIFLGIVLLIDCVFMVAVILLQKKRESGLGSVGVGSTQGGTFWEKNKGRSMEGKLELYTKISGVVFFVVAALIGFVS
ncbi:MAG: preprotein translocase subunit SecG [Clostridiales bacterium]|jgi:preprotein translocase subunit SecG|nr:preprotein translocase subunit SecG [Clostridiales bacterium]